MREKPNPKSKPSPEKTINCKKIQNVPKPKTLPRNREIRNEYEFGPPSPNFPTLGIERQTPTIEDQH